MGLFTRHEKPTSATGTYWEVNCAPECGFTVRTHDQRELVRFVQEHSQTIHGKSMMEADVIGLAKTIRG